MNKACQFSGYVTIYGLQVVTPTVQASELSAEKVEPAEC